MQLKKLLSTGLIYSISIAAAIGVIHDASAQKLEKRLPGLWEIQLGESPLTAMLESMQKSLAKLPAAQRKQMEEMMKGSGASLSKPGVIQQCVTPEMAARDFEMHNDDPNMQCTTSYKPVSSSEGRFTYVCKQDGDNLKGEGRIWDASAKHYKSEMTMQGVSDGKPRTMTISQTAQWVGPDCPAGLKTP